MRLRIGGLTPLTTIDFPGRLAAVVFCQGCAWRCDYCHNPHLLPVARGENGWQTLRRFLQQRRGLLDGVVFSGGEPLFQSGLREVVAAVRSMGFKTALHTAGTHPDRLRRLLPLLDWVGFDVKTAFERYPQLTGVAGSGARARESLALLLESGVDYEVRTTVDPALFNRHSLLELARGLADSGVSHYRLQRYRPMGKEGGPAGAAEEVLLLRDRVLQEQLGVLFSSFAVR